jgi:zinc transport system permease protein
MNFIEAMLSNPLLQTALLAGFFSSIVSGIVGSYVVIKRIVFISGSIAHSVLGGIGFALWLSRVHGITWLSPMLGAIAAALLSSSVIGWIHLNYRQREDSVIAALWSVGMATGVIFISQTPGYNVELSNFLIGNILWVSHTDLVILGLLDFFIVVTVLIFHKQFHALCFDEDQARLQGIRVNSLYLVLLGLIAVSVVLLIQVVGIILVITMLTIPPTIANLFTYRLSTMMVLAVGISLLFNLGGIVLSYYLDWPAGATIALFAGLGYTTILVVRNKV